MWIMLNDAFLSIVHKDCQRNELLVRARREGDIERIFPRANVTRSYETDYLFRAVIPRAEVEQAMLGELRRVTYPNFKGSVDDRQLHDAYLGVWQTMARIQVVPPHSQRLPQVPLHDGFSAGTAKVRAAQIALKRFRERRQLRLAV